MRSSSRGTTSARTTSARGSSSTGLSVRISPPSSWSRSARASARRCEPPRGKAQPKTCAVAIRSRPIPPLGLVSSGSIECAAWPASSARARSDAKALREPGRAREPGPRDREVDGVQETVRPRQERPQHDRLEVAPAGYDASEQAQVGLTVLPQALGGLGQRALGGDGRPVVERMRCGTGGCTQSTGSSRSRKNGDSRPSGWIAEQTSWTNPGQRRARRIARRPRSCPQPRGRSRPTRREPS